VIVPDPDQVCLLGFLQDLAAIGHRLEGLEFAIKFLDVLAAGRRTHLADIVLDATDGFSFESRNFLEPLSGIRHSLLDL